MSYDDVEIEDMEWNEDIQAFTYPCPCGDLFQITKEDLKIGEEIARCPSCSLYITVIYNLVIWSRTLIEFFSVTDREYCDGFFSLFRPTLQVGFSVGFLFSKASKVIFSYCRRTSKILLPLHRRQNNQKAQPL
jgi:diphthamide biosynthesis protein 3